MCDQCTDVLPIVLMYYQCTDVLLMYWCTTNVPMYYQCTDVLPMYRCTTNVLMYYQCTDVLPMNWCTNQCTDVLPMHWCTTNVLMYYQCTDVLPMYWCQGYHRTGKTGKMLKKNPCREKSGNLEILVKSGKNQGIWRKNVDNRFKEKIPLEHHFKPSQKS